MRTVRRVVRPQLVLTLLAAGALLGGCTAMLIGDGSTSSGAGSGTARASDSTIATAVRSRLDADTAVEASGIDVSSVGGRVTLTGRVSSYGEKERAGRLAASVSGVVGVENRLAVAAER